MPPVRIQENQKDAFCKDREGTILILRYAKKSLCICKGLKNDWRRIKIMPCLRLHSLHPWVSTVHSGESRTSRV